MLEISHLLALPAELRVLIWLHVLNEYVTIVEWPHRGDDEIQCSTDACSETEGDTEGEGPYVEYLYQPGKLIPTRCPPKSVWGVSSSGNVRARYPGHPLLYVSRLVARETVDMFFRTATFKTAKSFTPLSAVLPPVAALCQRLRRLSIRDFELENLFYHDDELLIPVIDAESDGVDCVKILSLPNLDYLEVKSVLESRCLENDGWIGHDRVQLALINYRKSFTCELHIVALDHGPEAEVQLMAVYSAGSLTFAYDGQVKKNLELEQLLHKAMYLDGGADMIAWMLELGQPDWAQFEPGSIARQRLRKVIEEDRFETFEKALDEFCSFGTSA